MHSSGSQQKLIESHIAQMAVRHLRVRRLHPSRHQHQEKAVHNQCVLGSNAARLILGCAIPAMRSKVALLPSQPGQPLQPAQPIATPERAQNIRSSILYQNPSEVVEHYSSRGATYLLTIPLNLLNSTMEGWHSRYMGLSRIGKIA